MQMNNIKFSNTSGNFEALLEAFFHVQPNEHIKAWRWHQYVSKYDVNAVDVALQRASAQLREARNV